MTKDSRRGVPHLFDSARWARRGVGHSKPWPWLRGINVDQARRLVAIVAMSIVVGGTPLRAPAETIYLNPADFTSLGASFNPGSTIYVDTVARTMRSGGFNGTLLYTGVTSGNYTVFTFGGITLQGNAGITIRGFNDFSLLSQGSASIAAGSLVDFSSTLRTFWRRRHGAGRRGQHADLVRHDQRLGNRWCHRYGWQCGL